MNGPMRPSIHLGAGVKRTLIAFEVSGSSFQLITSTGPHDLKRFIVSDADMNVFVLEADSERLLDEGRLSIAGSVVYRKHVSLRPD